jgi:hypothetical protein
MEIPTPEFIWEMRRLLGELRSTWSKFPKEPPEAISLRQGRQPGAR